MRCRRSPPEGADECQMLPTTRCSRTDGSKRKDISNTTGRNPGETATHGQGSLHDLFRAVGLDYLGVVLSRGIQDAHQHEISTTASCHSGSVGAVIPLSLTLKQPCYPPQAHGAQLRRDVGLGRTRLYSGDMPPQEWENHLFVKKIR